MRSMLLAGIVGLLRVIGLLGTFVMASCVFLPSEAVPCTERSSSLDNGKKTCFLSVFTSE
jgi:hypothetical protein